MPNIERAKIDQIRSRVALLKGRGEEATKQALVLPMLDALGYDIWNPAEVCPEFEADFAIKKLGQKEKVDLAIVLDGVPRVYMEVKSVEVALDGHEGQLARYFNATETVSLGILTNGVEYRFFTDTQAPNRIDPLPFYTFRIDSIEPGLDVLNRFSRDQVMSNAIRDYATELNYTTKMVQFLREQLDLRDREPNEQLVRWVLSAEGMYDGMKTVGVVARFRPLVKNALQLVLRDIVRRSVAALDEGVSAAPNPVPVSALPERSAVEPEVELDEAAGEEDASRPRAVAVTTERELAAFEIIRAQLANSALASRTVYDPGLRKHVNIVLNHKDTSSYFGVYLNKPGWWFARLVLESKAPWIGLNVAPEKVQPLLPPGYTLLPPFSWAPTRIAVRGPGDLHALSGALFAAIQDAIDARRGEAPPGLDASGEPT